MKPIQEGHPLHRLFKGMVEHAFYAELGVCDPDLVGYVADLLVQFVHVDDLYSLRSADGRPIEQVADMLALVSAASKRSDNRQDLVVYRHIGDFTLFWSGLFPENLRHNRGLTCKDHLLDYVARGKRSYAIVSELSDESSDPPSSLFGRLSREFEFCCYGLGLVRREWEHCRDDGPGSGPMVY